LIGVWLKTSHDGKPAIDGSYISVSRLITAEKAPYQKMYEKADAKFKQDMDAFIAAGGTKTKGTRALRAEKRKLKGKKKAAKDPNRPKRPAGGAFK